MLQPEPAGQAGATGPEVAVAALLALKARQVNRVSCGRAVRRGAVENGWRATVSAVSKARAGVGAGLHDAEAPGVLDHKRARARQRACWVPSSH